MSCSWQPGPAPKPGASRGASRGASAAAAGWHKAKAALRVHLERETRARDQHRHKQVHHAAQKADIHVVEANRHAAVRRRGGKSKSRMNRSLAEAGPAKTVQLLRQQCERRGRVFVEAPAPYNSRTCAACGSRDTKLTRARIACASCGRTTDRDANAAGPTPFAGQRLTGLCRPRAAPTGRFQPGAGHPASRSARCRRKALGRRRPLRGGSRASSRVRSETALEFDRNSGLVPIRRNSGRSARIRADSHIAMRMERRARVALRRRGNASGSCAETSRLKPPGAGTAPGSVAQRRAFALRFAARPHLAHAMRVRVRRWPTIFEPSWYSGH